jgi:hypothetical protein
MSYKRPQCTCPDSANKRNKLVGSKFLSETFTSDWSDDFGGIRSKGGYCKHELAVIIYRGEEKQAFPDGVPYQPPIESDLIIKNKARQVYDSDFIYL